MKTFLCAAIAVFLLACGQKENTGNADSTKNAVLPAGVSDARTIRPNIDYTPWDGNLYDAVYWQDKRGENIVLISGEEQYFWKDVKPEMKSKLAQSQDPEINPEVTELFARHYTLAKGESKWKLYYEFTDYLFGCCDVYMQYQPKTLMVMDADSSQTGDVVFMYHTTDGKGKADTTWDGHLVLLKDSAEFRSSGISGKGSLRDFSVTPGNPPYYTVLRDMWLKNTRDWWTTLTTPDTLSSKPNEDIHTDHIQ